MFVKLLNRSVLLSLVMLATNVSAQMSDEPGATRTKERDPLDDSDDFIEPKVYSPQDKKRVCAKYRDSYIAYAGNVYKVDACKTREIQNSDLIFEINKKREKITEVDAHTVAVLDQGEPITERLPGNYKIRTCKQLDGQYVTYTHGDVYFVDKCKKQLIPDWETFVEHKRKRHQAKANILALTWDEFNAIKSAPDMRSFMDGEFAKMLIGEKGVEVIPIDEACKGVDGKFVSFHSKFYKIEKCRKREIDPEAFWKRQNDKKLKIVELSGEQWLSLPDGKPLAF